MSKKHTKILIKGRVQGVFFRASTRDKAIDLGIKGWVRNESDGTVTIVAEGAEEDVEKLISWCHQGPPKAEVEAVHTQEFEPADYSSFTIER